MLADMTQPDTGSDLSRTVRDGGAGLSQTAARAVLADADAATKTDLFLSLSLCLPLCLPPRSLPRSLRLGQPHSPTDPVGLNIGLLRRWLPELGLFENLVEVFVALGNVLLVRGEVRVDETERGGAELEPDADCALVAKPHRSCKWWAHACRACGAGGWTVGSLIGRTGAAPGTRQHAAAYR